jgi:hypothetical protein
MVLWSPAESTREARIAGMQQWRQKTEGRPETMGPKIY